ncbi:MAG: peroxiredoxin [Chloroflexi bacterium]|nr:peroxiredoxin [Chloroflexota bacterium]
MVSIGELAPDFELTNQDGARVRLSDLRGRNVVLFAFPKANEMSVGCNTQACGFQDETPRIEAANAVVMGISPDAVAQMKKWHKARKLTYDLLSDPEHDMLGPYGAWGIPLLGIVKMPMVNRSYWVIDADGRIVDMQINAGPGESVKKALAALDRLGAAQSQRTK